MVIILGVIIFFCVVALSPWIIEGPKRWLRSRFAQSKGMT